MSEPRRYLVAAATSGLGFAVARSLVDVGHAVAICGRDETRLAVEEISSQSQSRIPLGRYGEPAEFASAARWLLSPEASYISGVTLTADGGLVAGV